jgi:hypothetical protein
MPDAKPEILKDAKPLREADVASNQDKTVFEFTIAVPVQLKRDSLFMAQTSANYSRETHPDEEPMMIGVEMGGCHFAYLSRKDPRMKALGIEFPALVITPGNSIPEAIRQFMDEELPLMVAEALEEGDITQADLDGAAEEEEETP